MKGWPRKALWMTSMALRPCQVMSLEVLCDYDGLKTRISAEITRFERAGLLVDDRTADCFGRNF